MGRSSKYPPEFRREAAELVQTAGRSVLEVATDLGISDSTLRNRINADRDARARAADPEGLSGSQRAEPCRLRKQNTDLKMDREIFRKARRWPSQPIMAIRKAVPAEPGPKSS